jgi:hypothetical protein
MSQIIKTYSDLIGLNSLEERFRYLALRGKVGETTFGFDRWMNQQFYRSNEWRSVRKHIIVRDNGCDLGIEGYEIHTGLTIHHLNPMTVADLRDGNPEILDPEFLITTTLPTHNAIHYGDERLLPRLLVERRPGDTKLW